MSHKKLLLVAASIFVFGPPVCFTSISVCILGLYLTEPWGWFLLFLLLGLPLGTSLVGLIIWHGNRHDVGRFQPSERYVRWRFNDGQKHSEPGPTQVLGES